MQIRRVLALSAVAVLALSAVPAVAQKKEAAPKRSQAEQQDIEALVRVVEASLTSEPILVTAPGAAASTFGAKESSSGDIKVAWLANHFVKGQDGSTYIPYTLTVDRAALGKNARALRAHPQRGAGAGGRRGGRPGQGRQACGAPHLRLGRHLVHRRARRRPDLSRDSAEAGQARRAPRREGKGQGRQEEERQERPAGEERSAAPRAGRPRATTRWT